MISWIQRTFQRHFRLLFLVILVAIGAPLVFVYRTGANGGSDHQVLARNFFGYNLSSPDDERRLMSDAKISIELQLGAEQISDQELDNYAYQRAAALYLAGVWRLPAATSDQVTDFIKRLRIFADANGQFDASRYNTFRDSLRLDPTVSESDIARIIGDDVRTEQVEQLLGGPGYVLPSDVKTALARSQTRWTIALATVDYAAFHPEIHPTEAELQAYFAAHSFGYTIPPRVEAGYVDFPAAAFAGGVTVTEAEARAAYDADPGRFPAPAAKAAVKAPTVSVKPAAAKSDFDAVRPEVEAAVRLDQARQLAAKAADDFVYGLYQGSVTEGPALDAFLAARHLALRPLAPFTQQAGPAELGGGADLARAAFQLDAQRYYSDALTTPRGAAVLIWKGNLASRTPLYIEVRSKVFADYLEAQRRQLFIDLGPMLRAAIAARLKAGNSFAQAAAAAGAAAGIKVEAKTLQPFTLSDPPADVNSTVAGALENLSKGEVSDMRAAPDRGYLVYALDVKAPDLRETGPLYAATRAQLGAYESQIGAASQLNELVQQELKKTEPEGQ